ncbi:MAG: hypothetical protein ACUVTW_14345 [Thermogutta sp.]
MKTKAERVIRAATAVAAVLGCAAVLGFGPGAGTCAGQQINAEAFAGRPFGVGKLTVPAVPNMTPEPLGLDGILVEEASGRVYYPAMETPSLVGGFFADLVNATPRVTIYFLFTGDQPLEITIVGRQRVRLGVAPQSDPRGYNRLLRAWWKQYTAEGGLLEPRSDYPPMAANYLKLMLAQRFGLPAPPLSGKSWEEWFRTQLGLALSTEPLRTAMMQSRFASPGAFAGPAADPLPAPWPDEAPTLAPAAEEIEVEPIARHVPAEAFYCRFGSFSNFLWLQDTLQRWGGDFQNLVALRSLNYEIRRRMEQQLVIRQSALARLLGETVVADVAIVGFDLYFHEGASFGLLFQARNSALFAADIVQQRRERLRQGDVREETLTIAGNQVSYLHSPDGAVRSYYAADGDFHLITSSRALAERFLEAGQGVRPLADSPEFRFARSLFPVSRQDTAFIYVSRDFLRKLTGPEYRVETQRRVLALADMDLLELALLAAAGEGLDVRDPAELSRLGFLPPSFGPRSDGSRAVLENGVVVDSSRGHRGAFIPIADMPVTAVSRYETEMYRRFLEHYAAQWRRLDPITAAVRRESVDKTRDRIVLDAQVTPLAKENFDRLMQSLGPADRLRHAAIPGNIGQFEAVLQRGRLFGGLADIVPPIEVRDGRIVPTGRLRDVMIGYIGQTGEPGMLGKLNRTFSTRPDPYGFSRGLFGLWRREMGGMSVYSFQYEVLAAVTPQLRWEETDREAQIRLSVGDLSAAQITPLLNSYVYWRTKQTSLGNLRLLRDFQQQLHVPVEDCKTAAELLLDVKLQCPLQGEYVLQTDEGGTPRWTSTAFAPESERRFLAAAPPPGFLTPPLNWLRGLELEALVTPEGVTAHVEVLMETPAETPSQTPDRTPAQLPAQALNRSPSQTPGTPSRTPPSP